MSTILYLLTCVDRKTKEIPPMNNIKFIALFLLFSLNNLEAQIYNDYLGNGHTIGVKVTSSSESSSDTSLYSISGSSIIPDTIGASRFLSQATLGANYEDIKHVSQIGVHAWLDEQMDLPPSSYYDTYREIYDSTTYKMTQIGDGSLVDSSRRKDYMDFAFYEKLFKDDDILRQRVALALSQILVVSMDNSQFNQKGFAISSYYDVLYQGAFGNFRDMLQNVTMHPTMGVYLSHFHNQKADTIKGTLPDENYAREVMQLFTVGLFQLNNDGTHKIDSLGKSMPTYDIFHVQELSKVFTGLSGGAWDLIKRPQNQGVPLKFGRGVNQYDLTVPMIMYDDMHDKGSKVMFTNDTIPAGQTGIQDINMALDILFNHSNVGPFIAIRLIQHLVKSNPSPAYVNRVAMVFNDNGSGVRGDLKAVVKAIFLDPEAIECANLDDLTNGKMIQPIERFINLFMAFDIQTPSGKFYWKSVNQLKPKLEQGFLASPTVFNFFTPFYAEDKHVAPEKLVSPEFQLLHSTSGIHYLNLIENAIKNKPFNNNTLINPTTAKLVTNQNDIPFLDLSDEQTIYETQGIDALLDRLDLILCRGQLSSETKSIIAYAINQFESRINSYDSERAVEDALYFIISSPNYIIQK